MQLGVPPTARGFIIPWELNAYSFAVLQQQIMAFLEKKGSTLCGIQLVPQQQCTEVYIYATAWQEAWKKEAQDICYKATATGILPGMGVGMANMGTMGMGMGMGMIGGCGPGMNMVAPAGPGPGSMSMGGCGMGSMGMMMGMGVGMGIMGMGIGCGLGPACPPMMHGAPINWANRPLPTLADRAPPAAAPAPDRRPLPKV